MRQRSMLIAKPNGAWVGSSVKELPLWSLKCSVCGLGMISWSQAHVRELLALHLAEHEKTPAAMTGVRRSVDG